MDCVSDATKRYDIVTHSLNNIMFLNTIFLALNVHFERTEVVFQIPFICPVTLTLDAAPWQQWLERANA